MRYLPIGKDFFIQNRQNFIKNLRPGSIAVFNSNDIYPTNADGTMPFRQNNDLFYLTGIDQEETMLLLFPDAKEENMREILFIKETNEHVAIWEGQKLSKKEASEISGIARVVWVSQFESIFETILPDCQHIYLNSNEHNRSVKVVETRDDRFVHWCQEKYPLYKYERSAPILHSLRAIKASQEIEMICKACEITEKAFRRILGFIRPGIKEYEIEAEFLHEFVRNGSRGPAYQPIIASGANSCILHYISNNQVCKDGDIILMDVAAEYGNYASDFTRVVPVNGKFSKRQKDVYNAVLRVMRGAFQMLTPGNDMKNYNAQVGNLMEKELVDLGLLKMDNVKKQDKDNPLYKKYFMHGTSHALGLDVHDVFDKARKFEPGMVFTVEPGIYTPEEGFGIRIENDVWISEKGPVDLMKNIPIEAEDIENLMFKR
ncbi:MAG: aminopeptidase P N-terminal domain-containing protein [Cytophagaceae bacterium]|nr:aminopeptidase P N-terminal domain-containing protein [Cytophagaceae bacterium]